MSDFNNGARYMRDNIIATIIGMQNGVGEESDKYVAYQDILDIIVAHHGDLFKPSPPSSNEVSEFKCHVTELSRVEFCCEVCGEVMHRDNFVLTSNPPRYQYTCSNCGRHVTSIDISKVKYVVTKDVKNFIWGDNDESSSR